MATESMTAVRAKLADLNRLRDTLRKDIMMDKSDANNSEDYLATFKRDLETRVNTIESNKERSARYEELVKAGEDAYKRLSEGASKLDETIKTELEGIKGVPEPSKPAQ